MTHESLLRPSVELPVQGTIDRPKRALVERLAAAC